jgi:hypothetical protein
LEISLGGFPISRKDQYKHILATFIYLAILKLSECECPLRSLRNRLIAHRQKNERANEILFENNRPKPECTCRQKNDSVNYNRVTVVLYPGFATNALLILSGGRGLVCLVCIAKFAKSNSSSSDS